MSEQLTPPINTNLYPIFRVLPKKDRYELVNFIVFDYGHSILMNLTNSRVVIFGYDFYHLDMFLGRKLLVSQNNIQVQSNGLKTYRRMVEFPYARMAGMEINQACYGSDFMLILTNHHQLLQFCTDEVDWMALENCKLPEHLVHADYPWLWQQFQERFGDDKKKIRSYPRYLMEQVHKISASSDRWLAYNKFENLLFTRIVPGGELQTFRLSRNYSTILDILVYRECLIVLAQRRGREHQDLLAYGDFQNVHLQAKNNSYDSLNESPWRVFKGEAFRCPGQMRSLHNSDHYVLILSKDGKVYRFRAEFDDTSIFKLIHFSEPFELWPVFEEPVQAIFSHNLSGNIIFTVSETEHCWVYEYHRSTLFKVQRSSSCLMDICFRYLERRTPNTNLVSFGRELNSRSISNNRMAMEMFENEDKQKRLHAFNHPLEADLKILALGYPGAMYMKKSFLEENSKFFKKLFTLKSNSYENDDVDKSLKRVQTLESSPIVYAYLEWLCKNNLNGDESPPPPVMPLPNCPLYLIELYDFGFRYDDPRLLRSISDSLWSAHQTQ